MIFFLQINTCEPLDVRTNSPVETGHLQISRWTPAILHLKILTKILPISLADTYKTTLCYQNRLENLGNKFPVLKASYTESKLNSSKNKPSWYSSSEALCNLVNCSSLINLKPKNFKNKCVAKLRIYFISDWHKTRTNLSDGKLRTYFKYKCSFGPEKYLAILPFHQRKLLTWFRISSHKLMVERGRYKKLDRGCPNGTNTPRGDNFSRHILDSWGVCMWSFMMIGVKRK